MACPLRENVVSGKLTFGYLYDFRNPPQWRKPWPEQYAEILDVIAWTEEVGFEGAWVPEHHLADDGYMPSPLIALTAIAARTKRLRLGAAIALAPLYHPVRFAEDCAVLDIIGGGRLEMGVAIGYRKRETAAFGVDFTKRGKIFDEWLQIVTRLWAGETVDFAGDHFSVTGAKVMPPPPRGRIPLFIGGFGEKAIERVIRYGDGYIGNAEVFSRYAPASGGEGAAKVRITGLFTVVARDPERAMEELAPYYHHVSNSYGEWFAEDKGLQGLKPMTLEAFKASGVLQIMTPDAAIAMFRDLQQRLPIDHYTMMMPPGLPADSFKAYAQVFADEVIPAFR